MVFHRLSKCLERPFLYIWHIDDIHVSNIA